MKQTILAALLAGVTLHLYGGLPVAALERKEPVDFDREVLPFLRDNCLSCHSKSTTKGGLNLETPELMLKGGDTGPGLVPHKASDSLVFHAAAHELEDMKMPPRDNKAKAKNLTPEQLALLRRWVDEGAKPSAKTERLVKWQTVPDKLSAIMATAVTADGQFAACSRANRVAIYHLPTGRTISNEVAHRDQVNALAFSPDGMLLASGGYREVKLWRSSKPVQKQTLAHAGSKLALSPDGKWLATAGTAGNVKLWTLPEGKPGATIATGTAAVTAATFSPDGAMLACATADKTLSLWGVIEGKLLALSNLSGDAIALAWVEDQLASAGADGVIRIWKGALAPEKELSGHAGAVTALHAIGKQLLSGGADGTARVWDVEKGQATIQLAHGGPITAVAIRPDGKRFASAGANKLAKLWDATGKAVAQLKGNRYLSDAVEEQDRRLQVATGTVAFRKEAVASAEKQLVAGKELTKKMIADLPTKQTDVEAKQKALADARGAKEAAEQALVTSEAELKKADEAFQAADKVAQQAKAEGEAAKTRTPVDQAAVDKATAEAATRAQEAAKAKADRDQRETQRKQAADKIAPAVKAVAEAEQNAKQAEAARRQGINEVDAAVKDEEKFTAAIPQAKVMLAAAEEARKKAEAESLAAKQKAAEAELPIQAIAFSSDNLVLATAGDDKEARIWSAETGAPAEVLSGSKSSITALAFTASGELITAAADNSLIRWDIATTWKLERSIGSSEGASPFADRVCALAFSPDGKLLATGGGEPSRGGEIKFWNPESGELIRDVPDIHSDAVLSLEFSPDNLQLLSGAADRMARIIDVASGKLIRTLEGHSHHVLGVSWSPEGRAVATAGADNTVKVWNAATGDRKKNIEGAEKEVTAVHFVGTGDKLLSASGDNKVRLVKPDGGQVLAFGEITGFVNAAAATASGKLILAGGFDSILRVWNGTDGKTVATFGPGAKQ